MGKWVGKDMYDEEKPCFHDYRFSFGEDDGPMECEDDEMFTCRHLADGGAWENCEYGALCSWFTDGTPPRPTEGDNR